MRLTGKNWRDKLRKMLAERPAIATKNEAFVYLQTIVKPTAKPADMERAIRFAYEQVSGFAGLAHKDCVCVAGVWGDLIEGYQGPDPKWRKDPHAERVAA